MLAHSFLIELSSKLLITRGGIKAWTSSISGLWFPWPIYIFFDMRFDLGTLDSDERSLPFGLLVLIVNVRPLSVFLVLNIQFIKNNFVATYRENLIIASGRV